MEVTALLALPAGWLAAYVIFIRTGPRDERPAMRVFLSFVAGAAVALLAVTGHALLAGAVPSGADFIPAGLLLLGAGTGWMGQKAWVSGQLIANTPVSRIRSAPQGWVKLRGKAVAAEPVFSRTGSIPCLYFTETTQRYTRHTLRVQDPLTKEWRTEVYHSWDHYSSASAAARFRLADGTGEVEVDVRQASFVPAHTAHFYNGIPGTGGRPREGDFRTTVKYIAPDSALEATGNLHLGTLTRHPANGPPIVGEGSLAEAASMRKLGGCLGVGAGGALIAAVPLAPLAMAGAAKESGMDFNAGLSMLLACAAAGLVILGWMVSMYNTIIALKRQAGRAWADIDVQLQMRWDLVPNLVETVKAYARHEGALFEAVLAARERALTARNRAIRIAAEERLDTSLPSVLALAEDYPQLKASENFLKLQQQLQEIENAIADRRETYNDSATNFNTFIQSFPGLLMAGALSEKPLPLFQAEAAARQHPLSGGAAPGTGPQARNP